MDKIFISIVIPLIIGFLGSAFTMNSVSTWYPELNKPFFNPPSWIFGPVWTILYIMIGISIYLVWTRKENKKGKNKETKKKVFWICGIQLFFNFIWSILFFGNKLIGLAFVDIIFLLIAILFNIYFCYKISRNSAYLLIPYLLWVSFASIINFAIWILN